ncbi:UNVERIFIED_CONTAM: hypothetical protein FKN15_061028 [Acipenser sinensis]
MRLEMSRSAALLLCLLGCNVWKAVTKTLQEEINAKDMTEHLNTLNLSLQGKCKMVSDMLQCVLSFQSKVGLLSSDLQSTEFTHHFPKHACITTERPELKDHYIPDVFVTYMTQLRERFEA